MKRAIQTILALIGLVVLILAALVPPRLWEIKVGGIIGEKAHVRSEIDGVVLETNVIILAILSTPVDKTNIDYWITKTATNQDLWIKVSGPGHRYGSLSHSAPFAYQAGLHLSIKKRQGSTDFSVRAFRYRAAAPSQ